MLPFVQEPLRTPDAFNSWVYHHFEDHQEIIDAIRKATGLLLPMRQINIITPDNTTQWQYDHQQMHFEMAEVLGIEVANLEDPDFEDPGAASDWFYLNLRDHEAAHQVLGI